MVLGVGRVDGDQRQVAEILAALHRCGRCGFGFGKHGGREGERNFMGVDGDHGDGFFRRQRADHFKYFRLGQTVAAAAKRLHLDEVAILRAIGIVTVDDQFSLAALHRLNAQRAIVQFAQDTENRTPALFEHLHDAPDIGRAAVAIIRMNAGQNTIAHACGDARTFLHADGNEGGWAFRFVVLIGGTRDQAAFCITRKDVKHHDVWQMAGADVLLATGADHAFRFEFGKNVLQPDAMFALDVEGFGQFTLAGAIGIFGDVAQDLFLRRQIRSIRPCCLAGRAFRGPACQVPNSLSSSPRR